MNPFMTALRQVTDPTVVGRGFQPPHSEKPESCMGLRIEKMRMALVLSFSQKRYAYNVASCLAPKACDMTHF